MNNTPIKNQIKDLSAKLDQVLRNFDLSNKDDPTWLEIKDFAFEAHSLYLSENALLEYARSISYCLKSNMSYN